MEFLPAELIVQIYTELDSSTKAQWHSVCRAYNKPSKAEYITAGQALRDGHLTIFREYNGPLLSRYYKLIIKGSLSESDAIQMTKELINANVPQSNKLPFLCVKHNKEYLYALVKRRDRGLVAVKSVAYGCSWLPRSIIRMNPPTKKLLKYAVQYGNAALVETIVKKHVPWVTEKLLWLAKVRGQKEILSLLIRTCSSVRPEWIYVIDDAELFSLYIKDTESTDQALFWSAIEITAFILREHRKLALPEVLNNNRLLRILLHRDYDFKFQVPYSFSKALLTDYPLFYHVYLQQRYSTWKRKYHPFIFVAEVIEDRTFDEHYTYFPDFFLPKDNLTSEWPRRNILAFTRLCGTQFLRWCIRKGVPFQAQDILRYAVQSGHREMLEFILSVYTPCYDDFLYTLGREVKEVLEELKINKGYRYYRYQKNGITMMEKYSEWERELSFIDLVYNALENDCKSIPDGCSDKVVQYLQWRNYK